MKRTAGAFALIFVIAFIASALVSLVWNLLADGSASVDWGHSVRLAIILGILLTWLDRRKR
jgi:hypothetical protein